MQNYTKGGKLGRKLGMIKYAKVGLNVLNYDNLCGKSVIKIATAWLHGFKHD